MLGRDALKVFQKNLQHWEIGRFEVQSTFVIVESAGTSNPKPSRSFGRGDRPSFKGEIQIAPRLRVRVRKRRMAAAAVKINRETDHPDHPRGIYTKNLPPEVSGPWAGVSG